MKNEVRVEELEESSIDDLIYICSSVLLEDPVHAKGTLLKRNRLRRMLSEAQRLGIGTTLLQSLIQDCRNGLEWLSGKLCTFIVTKPFKFLSLPEFYERNGFKPSPTEPDTLYLDVTKPYIPAEPVERSEPLPEDRGKAIVFYSPVCQFSYQFAVTASRMITEVAPELQVKMFDSWEKPEESIKRKNWWLIVNARPIYKFFMEEEEFKAEVKGAVVEEKNKA